MSNKNKLALEIDRCHRQIEENTKGRKQSRNSALFYGALALVTAAGVFFANQGYDKYTIEYKNLSESVETFYAKAADFKGYREDMTDGLRLIADEIETGKVDYSYINECLANFKNVGSSEHIDSYLEENEPEKFEEISTLKNLQAEAKSNKTEALICMPLWGLAAIGAGTMSSFGIADYLYNRKRLKEEKTTLRQLLDEANGSSPKPAPAIENKEQEM
ncbi:MAG: hypothetical protein IJA61_02320 [Clostridia bacterium]|nr:hypothetical protein [Clostridia bacterium]